MNVKQWLVGVATAFALTLVLGSVSPAHARKKVQPAPAAKDVEDDGCDAPFRFKRKHPTFQRNLMKRLWAKGFDKYFKKELMSVSVVDLTRKGKPYYAGINDNKMMYSASLPKIAILLSVVNAVSEGKIEWTHTFDRRLQNMITASSNSDASWGVDLVGLLEIEKMMRDKSYCFYVEEEGGGLWVGRAYRGGGGENRDPLFNISHGATSRQAVRFYAMLEAGKLVSPHWSFRMLGLMSPPKHFHKFVGGLRGRDGVIFLARKSGTWRFYHADSALIQHQGRVYAVTGIAETKDGERLMRELIQVVDDIIMEGAHRKSRRPKRFGRR